MRSRSALAGLVLTFAGWRAALAAIAALPLAAWLLSLCVTRATPNRVHPRPAGESMLAALPAVLKNRKGMLSIWGYTAHNWELLGMWAWLPAFLTAAFSAGGDSAKVAAAAALSLGALTYVANIGGSIVGGTMADRWGRTRTILLWSSRQPRAVLFDRLADAGCRHCCWWRSPACTIFRRSPTRRRIRWCSPRACAPHYLGVAYAVRSVVGFGAGVVSPVVFGWTLDLAGGGTVLGRRVRLGCCLGDAWPWRIARTAR